nr:tyrosine-type recombinase/integrase [uncultured Cohaesibacter sp.]
MNENSNVLKFQSVGGSALGTKLGTQEVVLGRSAGNDKRYLEQHGNKWRVVVSVPRELQDILGTKLKKSLGTDSLSVANRMKWGAVAELKQKIAEAQDKTTSAPHIEIALEMAKLLKDASTPERQHEIEEGIDITGDMLRGSEVGEEPDPETGEPLPRYNPESERRAGEFMRIAKGLATPIDLSHNKYLDQLTVKPRTKADDIRSMKLLKGWMQDNSVGPFLETIDSKTAVRFMDALPELTNGLSPVTLNKYIRRLSRYWQWLQKRSEVDQDIWKGLSLSVPVTPYDEVERAFTDEEIITLLHGDTSQAMHDLMRIGALTGCRIDPIVCLKVKDCQDGVFIFKPQKKEKRERSCPIHSALEQIIKRRCEGKELEDDVFPEWPLPKKNSQRERSFKASQQFTDYRRKLGVDEVIPGKRRSLVNFHSFRRWFITQAERADQPEHIIAAVVGHKRPGMTLGRYSAGPKLEQAKRCVEAVRLP